MRLLGELDSARDFAESGRAAFAEVHDSWESHATVRLAEVWLARGKPAEAQRFALDALAIARNRGLVTVECGALAVLGDCRRRQGDFRWAATYLERSHRLATDLADAKLIGTTLIQLGELYLYRGDVVNADRAIEEAHEHTAANKLVLLGGEATRLRADVALRRGNVRAAHELCDSAISQQRRTGCLIDLERSLSLLADVLAAAGQPEQSQAASQEAASLRTKFFQ